MRSVAGVAPRRWVEKTAVDKERRVDFDRLRQSSPVHLIERPGDELERSAGFLPIGDEDPSGFDDPASTGDPTQVKANSSPNRDYLGLQQGPKIAAGGNLTPQAHKAVESPGETLLGRPSAASEKIDATVAGGENFYDSMRVTKIASV